jgi:hypothetical protein
MIAYNFFIFSYDYLGFSDLLIADSEIFRPSQLIMTACFLPPDILSEHAAQKSGSL